LKSEVVGWRGKKPGGGNGFYGKRDQGLTDISIRKKEGGGGVGSNGWKKRKVNIKEEKKRLMEAWGHLL